MKTMHCVAVPNKVTGHLVESMVVSHSLRSRFTKQGKLALERNSIKAPMGG